MPRNIVYSLTTVTRLSRRTAVICGPEMSGPAIICVHLEQRKMIHFGLVKKQIKKHACEMYVSKMMLGKRCHVSKVFI